MTELERKQEIGGGAVLETTYVAAEHGQTRNGVGAGDETPDEEETSSSHDEATILSPSPETAAPVQVSAESGGVGSTEAHGENHVAVGVLEPGVEQSSQDGSELVVATPPATDGEEVATEPSGASFTPVEEKGETHPRRLKDLDVGMELEGRVTSVALYGIFVDIGVGRDGLVHISEMSDARINSPSDLVQIGDSVRVRIKSVDIDARRISLTMRSKRGGEEEHRGRKRAEIDHKALSSLKTGDTVDGIITGMAPFGAFVDIGVGKDGLVHISELSDSRVERPEDAVQVNQQYTFKLLEIDSEGNRISLSLRRAQRSQKLQQLTPGQILEGKVSGLAEFGAFVDIGVGRDGLVHISQLSENRVDKVEDVVNVGDSIMVRVLEVDPQSKRISLTMRLEEPEPKPKPETDMALPETTPSMTVAAAAPAPSPRPARSEESRRDGGGRKRDQRSGSGRGQRSASSPPPVAEAYTSSDDETEEEFEGNATLEDLLTKFGNPNRRDRRRRVEDEDEDEDDEERFTNRQRQRDAIRRTLHIDEDDE